MVGPLMRVLVIPDKFKGTLSAQQAASAMARGWSRVRPADTLRLLPMSDGGDGFGEVMGRLLGAKPRFTTTVNAAHQPCRARWWWEPRTRTAVVESAEVIGLAKLPPGQFHPFDLDTAGLGKLLTVVAKMKPRRCFIGIGGSATNDGGFGLARSLGWRFINRRRKEITTWPGLIDCQHITKAGHRLKLGRLTVALDVQNRLLGAKGCTRVYGLQKGLRKTEFIKAETALRKISKVIQREYGESRDDVPGAGAAGGLGFGLMSFLDAKPVTGFSLFAQEAGLTKCVRAADLVITGEGCLDEQSLMGKGPGELLGLCERWCVPCVALSGRLELRNAALRRFAWADSLTSLTHGGQAVIRPRYWLAKAAGIAAAQFGSD